MASIDDRSMFGQWLKRRRRALDWTQEALAERVGCAASTLQKIEQGARRPSRDMAERLLDVLGVPSEERSHVLRLARAPLPARLAPEPGHPNLPLADPGAFSDDGPPPAASLLASSSPLILTKILPPPAGSRIVPRERLTGHLTPEHGGVVTLIAAPAGFGKTTVLTTWLASLPPDQAGRVAWVALDAADGDAARFLRYLAAAVQRCRPALAATTLQLLDTPQPAIEAALTLLINDIARHGSPLTLVLDDYHVIRAAAIHQVLAFLIEHLPPNLHLVLATREDPPLPLARLRTGQRLHEIRAGDLRFTTEEAAAFFAEAMGIALDSGEIAALEQRTEGWIAGLQFAALALRDRADRSDFIRSFSGSHRLVVDYLAEEVFARLPPHLHEFLLRTAILERLCGSLCDALLELGALASRARDAESVPTPSPLAADSYSQLLLDELERINLFLVPLDDERRWYRYHHLFGAVLRERLQRGVSSATIAALHGRAARWFEAHGSPREAIQHAIAGDDWHTAARLIAWIGDQLLQEGAIETLRAMIQALPEASRQAHPRLVYLLGLCARHEWDTEAGRALFQQAADLFGAMGDEPGRSESLVYLADCYRMGGAYAEARSALDQALAGPLPAARRAIAIRSRAYQSIAAGDWQQALRDLDQAFDLLEQSGDRQALYELAINLRSTLLGVPGAGLRVERVRRLIHGGSVAPLSLLRAADQFLGGCGLLLRGQLPDTYVAFAEAVRLDDQLGARSQITLDACMWRMRCAALLNDFDTAHRDADRIAAILHRTRPAPGRQAWDGYFLSTLGWLAWLEGRHDEARALADELDATATEHEWPIVTRIRRVLRAMILLADRSDSAEQALQAALADQQQFRDSAVFADAGLLLASLYIRKDREADALALLDDVLGRHAQEGTPGLVLVTGAPVLVPLLRLAVTHAIHASFATQLLRSFRTG